MNIWKNADYFAPIGKSSCFGFTNQISPHKLTLLRRSICSNNIDTNTLPIFCQWVWRKTQSHLETDHVRAMTRRASLMATVCLGTKILQAEQTVNHLQHWKFLRIYKEWACLAIWTQHKIATTHWFTQYYSPQYFEFSNTSIKAFPLRRALLLQSEGPVERVLSSNSHFKDNCEASPQIRVCNELENRRLSIRYLQTESTFSWVEMMGKQLTSLLQ